jgi:cytochrome P450
METAPSPDLAAGMPLVRGLASLVFFTRFVRDPLAATRSAFDRYGPLVAFDAFAGVPRTGRTTVFAVGAPYNRAVLGDTQTWHTGHLPTGGPPGSALYRLGENLVSLNGPRHAYYRKLLARPLRNDSVEAMGDDIGALVAHEVANWRTGPADLWPLAEELVRTVAVALLFSGDQARVAELSRLLALLAQESKSPGVYLSRAGFPGGAYQRLLRRADEVENIAADIGESVRGSKSERDLIALIVNSPDHAGAPPSRENIAGHIPILFGAAYETCQTVLTWTLFLLAQHPRIAEEVAEEARSALAGTEPTLARVSRLPRLDAVVKESIRLLPPVPYQTRIASKPAELAGNPLARGTYVILSAFLTNRAPEIYDEPTRFKPERWAHINPSSFEYLAFSAGPRTCPGFAFGTSVVKVAVAAILSRFRITLAPDTRIDYRVAVTMSPRHGLPATLHEADGGWRRVPVSGQIAGILDMGPQASP